jgi:hypothetical protein
MRRLWILSAVSLLAVANTWAAGIFAPISDQLTVFDSNANIVGQVGVREDGSIFGLHAACNGPTCGSLEGSANIYYIDVPVLAAFSTPTMVLESSTVGSDVFGTINLGIGYLTLFFNSDSEAVEFNPGVGGYILVPEGDGFADATPYLASDLIASGFTAQFFSDPEVAPEPGTVALFAAGIAALAWRRLRLKTRS